MVNFFGLLPSVELNCGISLRFQIIGGSAQSPIHPPGAFLVAPLLAATPTQSSGEIDFKDHLSGFRVKLL